MGEPIDKIHISRMIKRDTRNSDRLPIGKIIETNSHNHEARRSNPEWKLNQTKDKTLDAFIPFSERRFKNRLMLAGRKYYQA